MGTRADFYVGQGEQAEWLGSIAWDGYPDGVSKSILRAKTEKEFRKLIDEYLANREDGTTPEMGWPWPWKTSHTTDYSYAFFDDKVWGTSWGYIWFDPLAPEPEVSEDAEKLIKFPTFEEHSAKAGSKRSGIMVIGVPKQED